MRTFGGRVLFLDRSDINTDEIIPAKYLTELSKEALRSHCLEDLRLPGFEPGRDIPGKGAILSRSNFGCGSSREHAPWAFESNGIHIVAAENFARIFRQNMFNGGMIAVELPAPVLDDLFRDFSARETTLNVDLEAQKMVFSAAGGERIVPFKLNEFERALVQAGGWVQYAAGRY